MADRFLTFDVFHDKVGQSFCLDEAGMPPIEFKLIEAKLVTNYLAAQRAPFSLLFTTSGDLILPQRLYRLRNAVLGVLSIFMVPVAKANDTVTYQAIFN